MTPQLVGISKNDLPLGKLSGKHAFAEKLKSLGYDIEPQNQAELFKQFKAIADKKKSVTDRDIHAIIQGTEHEQNAIYQVDTLQLQFVSNGLQSAVVVIKDKNGNIYQDSSIELGQLWLYIMQLIAFLNIKVNSLITVLILSLKVPTLKQKYMFH